MSKKEFWKSMAPKEVKAWVQAGAGVAFVLAVFSIIGGNEDIESNCQYANA